MKNTSAPTLTGFGNHFESEALAGALPVGRNSPQRPGLGLYAEQISGTSFLALRHENLKTWMYRIQPSVAHGTLASADQKNFLTAPLSLEAFTPEQLRWDPLPMPKEKVDFLAGLQTWAANGDAAARRGCAAHLYACNAPMENRFFSNADGELVIVPQEGTLEIATELGVLNVPPGSIAVVPRGIKFQVTPQGPSRGYVGENYGLPLRLPHLGPIGSNGLANPRDFHYPTARFVDQTGDYRWIFKSQGRFFSARLEHHPLDVVAWHGNYAPYVYDLYRFNTIGSISYDHPDPSIFTVLTSPSELPGISNLDFVIFPPRWLVAEDTFRPPYFHRNAMSEFMGLVHGVYDAKPEGFVPGGASLHNCMSAHGPDRETFHKASDADLKPVFLKDTMAFMFESMFVFIPSRAAMTSPTLQKNYLGVWGKMPRQFQHP